jgi:hypothetical protein
MTAGFDAARLAGELVDGLRDVFLSAMAPELRRSTSVVANPSDGAAPLVGPARCVRALEVIGTAIVDMREALDARTTFEVALVRLTHPEVDENPGALLERIERLERRVQELTSTSSASPPASPVRPSVSSPAGSPASSRGGATTTSQPAPDPDSGSRPTNAPLPGASPALGAYLRQTPTPPAADPPTPQTPTPQTVEASVSPVVAPEPAKGPSPASSPGIQPTRDDLVLAWGDHVLSSLKPRARAVYNVGRFVAMEDGVAVFALPNSSHVEHAAPLVTEVAEAISRQVGAPVGLRLVIDSGDGPAGEEPASERNEPTEPARRPTSAKSRAPAPAAAVPEPHDEMSDFDDAGSTKASGRHDSASWAEGRLLEAFPGTEEVP